VASARTRDHPAVGGDVEAARIRSHYRRLVLLGKARLPLELARKLVGPDCAYHLYFRHETEPPSRRGSHRRRRRATAAAAAGPRR
jgi:hypothetical protein